ncbi:cell division protein ZapA [Oceanibaculum nanhaiense]|uniref:cell division protein ZapA n=1 Tax=Oceanibaculum nanhaiense TaxID=1909734 RepID=UPI003F6EB63D
MASVEVSINGRFYRIACEDGQEQRLIRLAGSVDEKVSSLVEQVGQVGDTRLLVMASLLIADELDDAKHGNGHANGGANGGPNGGSVPDPAQNQAAIAALSALAERIEHIADSLESA